MDDGQLDFETSETTSFYARNRFLMMIVLAIVLACLLVATSLALYNSSGAAQLDMSRPGYQDVRSQVDNSDGFQDYSSIGLVDLDAVAEFKSAYAKQAAKVESVDAFGGDPLSPEALGLELTAAQ